MNKRELTDLQIKHRQQQREIQEEIHNHKKAIRRYIVRGEKMEQEIPEIKDMPDDEFDKMLKEIRSLL
jgi:hypothetical protein